jgi:hypothetical protein
VGLVVEAVLLFQLKRFEDLKIEFARELWVEVAGELLLCGSQFHLLEGKEHSAQLAAV